MLIASAALTVFVLYTGHRVGDHWIQTSRQASAKGACGIHGRAACAAHVASLILTQAALLALVVQATGLDLHPVGTLAGFALTAWTHYWADRREPLRALATALGKDEFYAAGTGLGTGAYALDQDWHLAWLIPAALLMTAPSTGYIAVLSALSAACMAAAITVSRRQRTRGGSPARCARVSASERHVSGPRSDGRSHGGGEGERNLRLVLDYLCEHPGAPTPEVARAVGLGAATVRRLRHVLEGGQA